MCASLLAEINSASCVRGHIWPTNPLHASSPKKFNVYTVPADANFLRNGFERNKKKTFNSNGFDVNFSNEKWGALGCEQMG